MARTGMAGSLGTGFVLQSQCLSLTGSASHRTSQISFFEAYFLLLLYGRGLKQVLFVGTRNELFLAGLPDVKASRRFKAISTTCACGLTLAEV